MAAHGLAVVALIWSLFPIVFIVLGGAQPRRLARDQPAAPDQWLARQLPDLFTDGARPYVSWYKNSLLIAGVGSLCSVFIGACAAYAFSRLRFVGRRPGLLALLLLQMFPALLAFVALYVTFVAVGDVSPSWA